MFPGDKFGDLEYVGIGKLPVRLDNAADIMKNRYFLFPTWCDVKSICDALFDVVTNMSVHNKEDITSLQQRMIAFINIQVARGNSCWSLKKKDRRLYLVMFQD